MVEVANPTLSVRRQGELLGLESYYYQAAPELNLQLIAWLIAHPLLWLAHDRLSAPAGLRHQWQAGQTADAYDASSYLPQEKQQFSWQGTQALSLSFAHPADYPRQPGLFDITYVPMVASCTWSLSSTGTVAKIAWQLARWTVSSVSMPCARRSARVKSSTPTKAHSSRPMPSLPLCAQPTFRSAWTAAAAPLTTSSANGERHLRICSTSMSASAAWVEIFTTMEGSSSSQSWTMDYFSRRKDIGTHHMVCVALRGIGGSKSGKNSRGSVRQLA